MKNWSSLLLAVIAIVLSGVICYQYFSVRSNVSIYSERVTSVEGGLKTQNETLLDISKRLSSYPDFPAWEERLRAFEMTMGGMQKQQEKLSNLDDRFAGIAGQVDSQNKTIQKDIQDIKKEMESKIGLGLVQQSTLSQRMETLQSDIVSQKDVLEKYKIGTESRFSQFKQDMEAKMSTLAESTRFMGENIDTRWKELQEMKQVIGEIPTRYSSQENMQALKNEMDQKINTF
ncbi:MAG: hypothetical protein WCP87_03700, partial [Atribacterota bacterium]